MIIIGLDGKEHKWNPSRKQSSVGDENRSKLHIKARAILKDLFPFDRVLEELTLPGTKTSSRRTLLHASDSQDSRHYTRLERTIGWTHGSGSQASASRVCAARQRQR